MYIQYLSNIFIAILENKTTQNKDEFWTLIPSNRQMALVFRGEKNPIIVPSTDVSGLETSHSTSNINTVQSLSIIFHP